jgi:hypothetical protein
MASNVEKLRDLGYSPGDVHYLHQFFDLGLVVLDSNDRNALEHRAKCDHLKYLINKGRFFLDQAIRFSLAGYKFGQVEFIQVEEKQKQEPELEFDPRNLKMHERHFYIESNKDVLRVCSGYIYSDYDPETDKLTNAVFVPF